MIFQVPFCICLPLSNNIFQNSMKTLIRAWILCWKMTIIGLKTYYLCYYHYWILWTKLNVSFHCTCISLWNVKAIVVDYCRTREPTTVRGSHKCNESSDTETGRLRPFKGDSIILALLCCFWLDVATKLLMWHY